MYAIRSYYGIVKTEEIMLADQKAKIQVASHSVALALGHAIADVADLDKRIEIIRTLIVV